jgi:hypothetical protein
MRRLFACVAEIRHYRTVKGFVRSEDLEPSIHELSKVIHTLSANGLWMRQWVSERLHDKDGEEQPSIATSCSTAGRLANEMIQTVFLLGA